MRDFDGPQEFLQALREAQIVTKPSSLLYVQALKFLETKATPPGARRGRAGCGACAARHARADAEARTTRGAVEAPSTDARNR